MRKKSYLKNIISSTVIAFAGIFFTLYQQKNQNNTIISTVSSANTSVLPLPSTLFYGNSDLENNLSTDASLQNNIQVDKIIIISGYENLQSKNSRTCYEEIKNNCRKILNKPDKNGKYPIESIVIRNLALSSNEIKQALLAVYNDNPEIFWIDNTGYTYFQSGNSITINLKSVLSSQKVTEYTQKIDEKAKEIIKNAPKNASEYEKELYIHDYIIKNCVYDKSEIGSKAWVNHSILGCLIENKAVCDGIAKSMQLLLNQMGIDCRTVSGISKDEGHMWNIIKIDGNYYHLDVTWDMPYGLNSYKYFNVDKKIILFDHKIDENLAKIGNKTTDERYNFGIPECNSMEANYYNKNAVKINDLNQTTLTALENHIFSKASKNESCIINIKFGDNLNYDEMIKEFLLNEIFFNCLRRANKKLISKNKLNDSKFNYVEIPQQNVVVIELKYLRDANVSK